MFKPLEVFIGLRYVRAKRRNHFISFISLISMLGIALGIWALITVLSVMNGFEKELRDRILGMASHASIEGIYRNIKDWKPVAEAAYRHPMVEGAAPYIEGQAMLSGAGQSSGVIVRGIIPEEEPKVSEVSSKMIDGSLDDLKPGEYGIILGVELAQKLLGTASLDRLRSKKEKSVSVIIPQATVTAAGILPRFKRFKVVGIFEVGMHEYDSGVALMHIQDASRIYQMHDSITGVRLRLKDLFQAPQVGREIVQNLPGGYVVQDWTRQHANLFKAINMEKRVMFIILFLIVAVAAFNIVSTLVMVVTDKESDIAILRTLGATPLSIMGIFMVQGSIIGFIGTILGIATGVPTALNVETLVSGLESLLGIRFLSPDIYYISVLTSDMQWNDVFLISGFSLLITLLATLYPAWRASKTQPAEALRYE
jgi:lipoprotein-releasing system permease protein